MKNATPGKNPASAMPSRKRTMTKLVASVTSAAPAEHTPQNTMMMAIQRRAPIRVRIMLAGTWNST